MVVLGFTHRGVDISLLINHGGHTLGLFSYCHCCVNHSYMLQLIYCPDLFETQFYSIYYCKNQRYLYALIFIGHILLHPAVGDLPPSHLCLQLTHPLSPSLHLLPQLQRIKRQRGAITTKQFQLCLRNTIHNYIHVFVCVCAQPT